MKNIYLLNSKTRHLLKNARLLLSAEQRIQTQLDSGFLLFIIEEPVAVDSILHTSGNL
jgi:hypothetical protein